MHECTGREQVIGFRSMARMRPEALELEVDRRELDRMIAALDRRFSALWTVEF